MDFPSKLYHIDHDDIEFECINADHENGTAYYASMRINKIYPLTIGGVDKRAPWFSTYKRLLEYKVKHYSELLKIEEQLNG